MLKKSRVAAAAAAAMVAFGLGACGASGPDYLREGVVTLVFEEHVPVSHFQANAGEEMRKLTCQQLDNGDEICKDEPSGAIISLEMGEDRTMVFVADDQGHKVEMDCTQLKEWDNIVCTAPQS